MMTDAVSRWLFTTEPSAEDNLVREGIDRESIHFVGNVMIDTLLANLERARELPVLEDLGLEAGGYATVTLHRPSNVDDPDQLRAFVEVLEELHRELPVVFPVHPRTRARLEPLYGAEGPALRMIDPLGYLDFLRLNSQAKLVLTDSGGCRRRRPRWACRASRCARVPNAR